MSDCCKIFKNNHNLLTTKHLEVYILLLISISYRKAIGFPSSFRVGFVARRIPSDWRVLRF